MVPGGAFAVLLLISGVSAEIVLPPTNVTVSCQNVKVTVSWKYRNEQQQTRFRVNISSSAGNFVKETTDHQYDLSHFVWESEDRYMGQHDVTVTAIQGGVLSEPVKSKSFTFNRLRVAAIECKLDFPPVDLNLEESGPLVSFINPLHYYTELKQAKKPDTATFKFNVSAAGKNLTKDCTGMEENCRLDFSYPEGVKEKCVNLTGWLFAGNAVGEVSFRKRDCICPSASTKVYWILLAVLLSVTVLIIIVITIIIWMAHTSAKRTPLPGFLLFDLESSKQYAPVLSPSISSLTVLLELSSQITNPSISSEEDDPQDGCSGLYAERGAAGFSLDDSADDSEKMECESLHSNQGERGAYDCPHVKMDMGDGDMVTGYKR